VTRGCVGFDAKAHEGICKTFSLRTARGQCYKFTPQQELNICCSPCEFSPRKKSPGISSPYIRASARALRVCLAVSKRHWDSQGRSLPEADRTSQGKNDVGVKWKQT
jgi:hypothetical protein